MLALPEATAKGPTPAWVALVLVRRAKLLAEHAGLCLERPVEGLGSPYASEADQLYKVRVRVRVRVRVGVRIGVSIGTRIG